MALAGFLFVSCESKKEKEEIQKLEQEAKAIDSVSVVIEKNIDSIQQNVEELDGLLNEIN